MLLAAVVGSGIMGERLSGGNVAIVLLANTLATGAALVALLLTFVEHQKRIARLYAIALLDEDARHTAGGEQREIHLDDLEHARRLHVCRGRRAAGRGENERQRERRGGRRAG
jgi:hypothetical protein